MTNARQILLRKANEIRKRTYYYYELDGRKIALHDTSIIELQESKGKNRYKTVMQFNAAEFSRAIMNYNMKSAHNGYNKRLICRTLNKPVLARQLSR